MINFFIITSLYQFYTTLKIIETYHSTEKNHIFIYEAHNDTYKSIITILPCLQKRFSIKISYNNMNSLHGFLGLLKKVKLAHSLIDLSSRDKIENFYTAIDREFFNQILLWKIKSKNKFHIEDGLEIYLCKSNYKESFSKFLIKKLLFTKYESLPYLGKHSAINGIWCSFPSKGIYNKFKGKKIFKIPDFLGKENLSCFNNKLNFDRILKQKSKVNLLILSNTKVIKDYKNYIHYYISLLKKIGINSILVKFHPREKNNDYKNLILKLLKSNSIEYEILPNLIPLEIFRDFLISENIPINIYGDISTFVILSKVLKDKNPSLKLNVYHTLKDLLNLDLLNINLQHLKCLENNLGIKI